MRIGDAAAAAGTTPRALRFYEQRGLLPPPARTAAGQREYGPAEVARVRAIRELLALGLTVEDLRSRAHRLHLLTEDEPRICDSADGSGPEAFVPVVDRRLAALDAEIARLTALRDNLARQARRTSTGPVPVDQEPGPTCRTSPGRASAR
ncbi:MerR family transcriptional regulator [Kitasatospora sp. NPDC058218]|uniref:MerR family transcriptional regulator n=1 Tax=Kitasatospora sp. NPDC058218 TaxID=3346385 RepID=UPI0036DD154B